MARLSNVASPSRGPASSIDVASAELAQLLQRLQQTVLHPTPERERRLRTSEYERARIESNLEYARTELTRLEQEALGVKIPARRLELQGALNQRREILELLLDRLEDLRQMATDDDDSSEGEDLLGDIIPTPSESMNSTSADLRGEDIPEEDAIPEPPTQAEPPSPEPEVLPQPSPSQAPTQTSQTLRTRTSAVSPSPTSHTKARAALFANRRKPAAPQTSTATTEAILDQQRAEQDLLSDSILKMAGALKSSSQRFASALEADSEIVDRAGEGLHKTDRSMEVARGRMGLLRKMTEGKGWWGRMILYAWVWGLMLTLVLLVFVMPKLRF